MNYSLLCGSDYPSAPAPCGLISCVGHPWDLLLMANFYINNFAVQLAFSLHLDLSSATPDHMLNLLLKQLYIIFIIVPHSILRHLVVVVELPHALSACQSALETLPVNWVLSWLSTLPWRESLVIK
jgi:hypothetical protein